MCAQFCKLELNYNVNSAGKKWWKNFEFIYVLFQVIKDL